MRPGIIRNRLFARIRNWLIREWGFVPAEEFKARSVALNETVNDLRDDVRRLERTTKRLALKLALDDIQELDGTGQ